MFEILKAVMHKFNSIIISIFFLPFSLFSFENFYPDRIIVKFAQGSPQCEKWLEIGAETNIDEFRDLLGDYSIKPYVRNALFQAAEKHIESEKTRDKTYAAENSLRKRLNSLKRIAIIRYESNIDPRFVAAKISRAAYIEYAEPMPIRKIFEEPNDPDFFRQYHLKSVFADTAWAHVPSGSEVLVADVDTGVDYDHEDLAANIWTNPGESGLDNQGNDKRDNGIDDDENGFIDDWRGWDFLSSNDAGYDNDPAPGNPHGTHTSGIFAAVVNNEIGVAGVAVNAKILPVKIGPDDQYSNSVDNSYEGILYAAIAGADLINCSWGGGSKSEAEREIIKTVEEMGAAVVASAGNDGFEQENYPAAYDEVLSVAALEKVDIKAIYSNFHETIDISAPGTDIYSTMPNDTYEYKNGTSMAAPIVAGVAAMVKSKYPEYNALQIREHIKATSTNIDQYNEYYVGKIGKGKIDALSALTRENVKSVLARSLDVAEVGGDGIIDAGDEIEIDISFLNALSPLKDVRVEVDAFRDSTCVWIDSVLIIGDMATFEEKNGDAPLRLILPEALPTDYDFALKLSIFDEEGLLGEEYASFFVRPSFRTMRGNNIVATFNSAGNIGFNDFPNNEQGEGFRFKDENMIFEGSLIVGSGADRVSNVARTYDQLDRARDFAPNEIFRISSPGEIASEQGSAEFSDDYISGGAGVKILQNVYQFDEAGAEDFIIVSYDVVNVSPANFDSLCLGLYFDWDVGYRGRFNYCNFDKEYSLGYARRIDSDTLPFVGAISLSPHRLNYFAMDNDGRSVANPGVYDGFSDAEKWRVISSGIGRAESNITDVSMVIGAGPARLPQGDTTRFAFCLIGGENLDNLRRSAEKARAIALERGIADGEYMPFPQKDTILNIYPNPADRGEIRIQYAISDKCYATLEIIDALGEKALTLFDNRELTMNYYDAAFSAEKLAPGRYYAYLKTNFGCVAKPFEIIR